MFQQDELKTNFGYHYQMDRVDSLVNIGLKEGAFPGCRILVAKDGELVYDRAYGTLDDGKLEPVQLNSVYDLASITKLAASSLP